MPYLSDRTHRRAHRWLYERASTSCCRGTGATTTWPGSTAPIWHDRIDALVAAGERSMRALVDVSDAQRIVTSDSQSLTNVNTDAELRALAQPRG